MKHFKFLNKHDIISLTKQRKFETKLGERIQYLSKGEWPQVLQQNPAKYVLVGIPEDIGVKANNGIGGADTAWTPFLQSFLNIQSNDFCTGEDVLLLGHFDFGDIKYLIENNAYNDAEKVDAYRHAVNTIDDEVENLMKTIAASGKIPIVIGGGHNNAYPLLKGVSKGLSKNNTIPLAQLNCINLDAHTDYRTMEGRHSGNGFRYAETDGYLGKYSMVGLHENYIPQNVLADVQSNVFMQYTSYEDIFVREKKNFIQAIAQAVEFTNDTYTGIELDMDAIQNTLSSATSPSGITALQARQYITYTASHSKVAYLHICEAACHLNDGRKDETVGKLLSYLVSDFVKGMNER
ncbi:formimidoylglutamase [Ferruginibacter yonginensis]|uniref:Formimidoylglutamase n=1 Tax=Ferruginibacter yonginensis TaxID=1310416 RepID=A0ABV8QMH0_9BACT